MHRIVVPSFLVLFAACGAASSSSSAKSTLRVVDANLPYQVINARTGRAVGEAEFWSELSSAQAICVGESHDDPHHHWAQLQVIERAFGKSTRFAMGMEMFQRPFQGVLDDFAEGTIGEKELLARSDWQGRWTYDWELYAPVIRATLAKGGKVLALNVSTELKDKWKKTGLENFSAAERENFPELNLADEQHRKWFRLLLEGMSEGHTNGDEGGHAWQDEPDGHGTGHGTGHGHSDDDDDGHGAANESDEPDEQGEHGIPDDEAHAHLKHGHGKSEVDFIDTIYPVQVLWDETMADTASKWLKAGDKRRIVILAGHGHCHDSAIVGRMKRRGIQKVISVKPVVESGEGETAASLVEPKNDYLFVMSRR